ncbi:hypothetical protein ONZ45_g4757 [Pleurotus djamor]|nr:hypothetical protein ONZ45_g4757 [Pleurotus djamor]
MTGIDLDENFWGINEPKNRVRCCGSQLAKKKRLEASSKPCNLERGISRGYKIINVKVVVAFVVSYHDHTVLPPRPQSSKKYLSMMFAQFCTLAFLTSLVAALTINPLERATSQGATTVTWNNEQADTSRFALFSVFLHHPSFRDDFAILNNVQPGPGSRDVTLPVVPAQDGYTLRATNVGNITDVYAESAPFFIGEAVSTSAVSSSTSASSSVSSGASVTSSGTGTVLSVPPTTSTTPFGTTLSTSLPATRPSSTSSAPTTTGSLTSFNAASRLGSDFSAWSAAMVIISGVLGGVVAGL